MSRDYPVPSTAANIWVIGDQIWLGFDGHSAPFPATTAGMQLVVATLRERSRGLTGIAQNGAPTRYQVERTLQRDKRWNEMVRLMQDSIRRDATKIAESEAFLKDLGLL